jgi:hypothetical protein
LKILGKSREIGRRKEEKRQKEGEALVREKFHFSFSIKYCIVTFRKKIR